MRPAGLCFSGGKDSTLAALLLAESYAVTCLTGTFGLTDDWTHARDSAAAVGLEWERVDLDPDIADAAVERMVEEGHPSGGLQDVHEHAIETVAASDAYPVVADGTRRDDRAPTVDRARARSIEDRHGVDYVAPLAGYGRGAIDALVDERLRVETGPSEAVGRADYEAELRALMARRHGRETVEAVFPDHEQSRVTGRR